MSLTKRSENSTHPTSDPMETARAVADVFDQSGMLFFRVDRTGRILQANAAAIDRLGYSSSEIESLRLADIVTSDLAGEAGSLLARLAAGETVIGADLVFQTRAGEPIAVRGMLSPTVENERFISALAMFKEQPEDSGYRRSTDDQGQTDPGILETLVESSPDGAMIVDSDLEIVAFNRNFLEIWRLDESTVRSGNAAVAARRIIKDPDAFFEVTEPYYADHELAGNGVVRLTDGRVLDWYTAAAYRSDGEYLGRVWYYRDATSRFLIEEELERSGELYRQLAMHFPNGAVFLYDHKLTLLLADGSGLTEFGISKSGIEGRTLAEALPEAVSTAAEPIFRAALAGQQVSRDIPFGRRIYSVTAVPVSSTSHDGNPQGMAIAQDVSMQRELEQQLRGAESRLRTLVEQIPVVTYIQEVDGLDNATIYVSPQVDRFGYTPEELINGEVDWLETIHPDDREMVLESTRTCNELGIPFSMEYRSLTKQGDVRWSRDEAAIIRDEHGNATFWQGIISDITDERKLEHAVQESEERFRSAFDEAPMGIAMVALDGVPKRYNNAMCVMLGYSEVELLELGSIDALVHPEDLEAGVEYRRQLQAGEIDRYRTVTRFVHRSEHTVWTQMDVSYVFNGEREPEYIIVQVQDISEQRRLEEELRRSEAVFRSAFDYAAIGMARVALDGTWRDVNASLCAMLGYSREELLNRNVQGLTHPDDLERDLGNARDAISGNFSSYQKETRFVHRSGVTIWAALSVSLVRDSDGRPLFFIVQIQDITAKKELENRLDYQAHHDGLTGLLNRYGLMKLLEHPEGDGDEVGILVIDMDGFKEVNDRYGHAAGDRVLQVVSKRIRSSLRDTDQVARLGGDEFVVSLGGPISPDVVDRLAARIQNAVSQPIHLYESGRSVAVWASIGATIGTRELSPTAMLKQADDAMYRAKRERQTA